MMIATFPEHSRKAVTRAGAILKEGWTRETHEEYIHAMYVLSNWRASHSYPINTFQATLRKKLTALTSSPTIVAQRLKRTPSIIHKLRRNESMELARMQDIGGLRAVLQTTSLVYRLHESYKANEHKFRHEFGSFKDYIAHPKDDGYRSLHQVFKYRNDRAKHYDGLQIELQIRTRLQHAWATAVETMSTFLNQGLKTGGGEEVYRDYLKTCSAAIALVEKSPSVPGFESLTIEEVSERLKALEEDLQVIPKLQGFSVAAQNIEAPHHTNSAYHLVVLDIAARRVKVTPYSLTQLDEASEAYAEAEKRVQNGAELEVVLVSAGTVKSLKKAYPNYFLDTANFVQTIERIIYGPRKSLAGTAVQQIR